jgi:phage tail-like protein
MTEDTSYFFLNHFNEWPGFKLIPPIVNTPEGVLTLDHIDEETFAPRAVFRGGPFEDFNEPGPWFRIQVYADPLPDGASVQIFTATTENEPFFGPDAGQPFEDPPWRQAPQNELNILVPNTAGGPLWIGGVLRSDGQHAPVLHQMRVDFGRDSYMDFLPAIYSEDEGQQHLLRPFLDLHESVLGGLEETIVDLPRFFDPHATPNDEYPSWLSWLASWLAFDLSETWDDAQTRAYLAQAFELYGLRGTVEGLRRYIKWYANVEARIEEPGLNTHIWSLGETSTLGFTTMLAPAHLQGAVLGTTATLDQSHLTRGERLGAVLFEDLAHKFCVQVYCAELNRPGALEDLRAVIEREKPAHTDYELCVIEPRMRVGVQARVGIDAIVAQGPPPAQIGMRLDSGVLVDQTTPCENEMRLPNGPLAPCPEEEV